MRRPNPAPPFVLKESDEPHLAKIAPKLVEPLRLAHAGNGYEHIATELLMIPVGTVKSRISRARERVLYLRAQAAAASASDQQLESADD